MSHTQLYPQAARLTEARIDASCCLHQPSESRSWNWNLSGHTKKYLQYWAISGEACSFNLLFLANMSETLYGLLLMQHVCFKVWRVVHSEMIVTSSYLSCCCFSFICWNRSLTSIGKCKPQHQPLMDFSSFLWSIPYKSMIWLCMNFPGFQQFLTHPSQFIWH